MKTEAFNNYEKAKIFFENEVKKHKKHYKKAGINPVRSGYNNSEQADYIFIERNNTYNCWKNKSTSEFEDEINITETELK
jgi:hypothetical protein